MAETPLVGLVMGSKSDWETLKECADTLEKLEIPFEVRVIPAHRAPDLTLEYATTAESRGLEVIITGAGGATHLAGVIAARTILPVFGIPIQTKALKGIDSLLSMVQMPAGIPVGTLAIGAAGAINAALLSAHVLGCKYPKIRETLRRYRDEQTKKALEQPDPRV